jgi:hypothetical protein
MTMLRRSRAKHSRVTPLEGSNMKNKRQMSPKFVDADMRRNEILEELHKDGYAQAEQWAILVRAAAVVISRIMESEEDLASFAEQTKEIFTLVARQYFNKRKKQG